jgi:hypothetical protein
VISGTTDKLRLLGDSMARWALLGKLPPLVVRQLLCRSPTAAPVSPGRRVTLRSLTPQNRFRPVICCHASSEVLSLPISDERVLQREPDYAMFSFDSHLRPTCFDLQEKRVKTFVANGGLSTRASSPR